MHIKPLTAQRNLSHRLTSAILATLWALTDLHPHFIITTQRKKTADDLPFSPVYLLPVKLVKCTRKTPQKVGGI